MGLALVSSEMILLLIGLDVREEERILCSQTEESIIWLESAAMWRSKLSADLATLGYSINKLDACVFNRTEKDHSQTTLLLHVDDMKTICNNELNVDQVIEEIEIIYPGLTKQRGQIINYLGMIFFCSVEYTCI